jgi:hypothetical protein
MPPAGLAGIDRSRVEDMEARLKRDVLREAARYEQHILVTEEDDDMNVSAPWISTAGCADTSTCTASTCSRVSCDHPADCRWSTGTADAAGFSLLAAFLTLQAL